ncbi:hypothetical protein ACJX0J_021168, partial [Zea mays]
DILKIQESYKELARAYWTRPIFFWLWKTKCQPKHKVFFWIRMRWKVPWRMEIIIIINKNNVVTLQYRSFKKTSNSSPLKKLPISVSEELKVHYPFFLFYFFQILDDMIHQFSYFDVKDLIIEIGVGVL